MSTLRAVATLALKDLRLLGRDRAALFFVLAFPLAFVLFFGAVSGGLAGGDMTIEIAVVDRDSTEASRGLAETLREKDALRLRPAPPDGAREAVRRGDLAAYVEILPGYGESVSTFGATGDTLLEIGTDPGRGPAASLVEGMVVEAAYTRLADVFSEPADLRRRVERSRQELARADTAAPGGYRPALREFLGHLDDYLGSEDTAALAGGSAMQGPAVRQVTVAARADRPRSPFEINFPQAILWGVIACVAAFAASLVRERQAGTFLRLRYAPLSRGAILAAKALACFVAIVAVSVLFLALGRFVFGVRIGSPAMLALAVTGVALGFVGLMMLLATLGRTEQAVSGASWAVLLVMAMVGGGMVPLVALPEWIRTVGHVSPVKWGILALEGAIWRGFDLGEMLLPVAVLLVIGAAAFAAGLAVLSRRSYASG